MRLSLDFMHWVDRYVGAVVVTLLQPLNLRRYLRPPPKVEGLSPRRVLLIKFWGMGSIALAGRTLAALKQRYPEAEFTFLTLETNRVFLGHVPVVDRVLTLEIRGGPLAVVFRVLGLFAALRKGRFDLVVDLEFFTRFSCLVSFVTGAPVRVGFHAWEIWRGKLNNVDVPFNRYWHVTENFFNLGKAAGITAAEAPAFRLALTDAGREEARRALADAGVADDERVVVINPNAGELALLRRWPVGNFGALAGELTRDPGIRPVFIGGPSEVDYTAQAVEEAPPETVNLAGKLSIGGLLALLDRAEAVITNDSGPLQLALTQGVPTLSFFGPETPVLYGPRDGCHRVLYSHIACSPCINVHSQKKIKCIHGRPICLEGFGVAAAAAQARALLDGQGATPWRVHG